MALVAVAGCEYEAPLTTEHNIAIDLEVLGLWELASDEGGESKPRERVMILPYSDTEYLVHYPVGDDGVYFRAYPIEIGGVSCVQIQVVGTHEGPLETDANALYHVMSYQFIDDQLEIRTLNTGLVDDDLKTTEQLRQAFLEHKDDRDLFENPGVFRKIEK